MSDIDNSSYKTFGSRNDCIKLRFPVKKCHTLDGKCFIVIDQSIVERLKSLGIDDTELYFQQEVTKDGSIVLHRSKIGEST